MSVMLWWCMEAQCGEEEELGNPVLTRNLGGLVLMDETPDGDVKTTALIYLAQGELIKMSGSYQVSEKSEFGVESVLKIARLCFL